ncbi:MAG: FRG domain-containing protein [Terriglobia bacterium]|jgi:hypothetical protein
MTEFETKNVTDWRSFVEVEAHFDQQRIKDDWVFRGQPSAELALTTTLERACEELGIKTQDVPNIELKVIFDFQRGYHLNAVHAPPEISDTLEWLAVMRHYGTPTRLLDFTYSFYIAAYFALEHAKADAAIWAISKTWLTEQTRDVVNKNINDGNAVINEFAARRNGKSFRAIFMRPGDPLKLVLGTNPYRLNDRLTVQQGLFLCPGDTSSPFSTNLENFGKPDDKVIKVIIGNEGRTEILRKLHMLGINRSLLFPGLDGYAESLRTKMLIFDQMRQMEGAGSYMSCNVWNTGTSSEQT